MLTFIFSPRTQEVPMCQEFRIVSMSIFAIGLFSNLSGQGGAPASSLLSEYRFSAKGSQEVTILRYGLLNKIQEPI